MLLNILVVVSLVGLLNLLYFGWIKPIRYWLSLYHRLKQTNQGKRVICPTWYGPGLAIVCYAEYSNRDFILSRRTPWMENDILIEGFIDQTGQPVIDKIYVEAVRIVFSGADVKIRQYETALCKHLFPKMRKRYRHKFKSACSG